MSMDDCLRIFREAAKRDVTDSDIDEYLTALESMKRYLKAKDATLNDRDAALKAATDLSNQLHVAAVIEKRNAALNYAIRVERVAWIGNNFGNNIALGIETMLVGSQRAKTGARQGAAQVQASLQKAYLAGFTSDIERTGHMKLFASGAMDRDVARALWALGREDTAPLLGKLPKEAVEIARVISKWQEVARTDANASGAWIGKREDYITKQSHDPVKVRGKGDDASYQAWRSKAHETMDIARMLAEHGDVDPEKMLRSTWKHLASGNHLKEAPGDVTGFKGPGNLAKKLSSSRSILFKDADSWFAYNQQFGDSNLRESVVRGLSQNAQATGLMQVMGTNPKAMLDAIKADLTLQNDDKVEMIAKLGEKAGRLDNFMAQVDGSMNIPGNALWARRGANVRSWESLSKLGGMLLSQLSDVAVYASGTRYQGRGFFTGISEAVGGLGRSLAPQDRRDLAASLGVVLDNMAGELGRAGAFAEGGTMSGMMQLFMKLNGSTWWTSRMRTSAAFGMSHHMAQQAGKSFDALGPDFQRVLSLYNIGAAEWKVISKTAAKHIDGNAYIVPEALRDVSDDAIRSYIGPAASDRAVAKAKRDLEDNLRGYFVDQTEVLALEPDAKTRAIILQGTRPGTVTGEMMRFLMQFKSFTGAFMQKILGRELYGRGYEGDSLLGALTHGNGEFTGLAQLMVTTTLMGYASMALKDVAKGRTPRDPTESPGDAGKTFLAAMLQGGGAGIYGDFLFGQASRFGSGTIESVAGPAISAAGRGFDLYHKALAGDDVAARTMNEVLNNTPFMNLFYTRAALNYLILYRVQEQMNPGYLRRMERQVEKENAQGFLLRPSAAVQ